MQTATASFHIQELDDHRQQPDEFYLRNKTFKCAYFASVFGNTTTRP